MLKLSENSLIVMHIYTAVLRLSVNCRSQMKHLKIIWRQLSLYYFLSIFTCWISGESTACPMMVVMFAILEQNDLYAVLLGIFIGRVTRWWKTLTNHKTRTGTRNYLQLTGLGWVAVELFVSCDNKMKIKHAVDILNDIIYILLHIYFLNTYSKVIDYAV